MDEISTRYIIIAVGIYITLIVLTSVIFVVNNVKDVFSVSNRTNISIQSRIDSIEDMYNGATLNGVDLVNAITRYEEDDTVTVVYPSKSAITTNAGAIKVSKYLKDGFADGSIESTYGWNYSTSFTNITVIKNGSKYTITFS